MTEYRRNVFYAEPDETVPARGCVIGAILGAAFWLTAFLAYELVEHWSSVVYWVWRIL